MSRKRVLTKSPKHKLKLIKEDGKSYIRKKDLGPYKYDFFFPKFNLLLELDGSLHEINRDLIKDELAANQGYKVIRIKLSKSLLNKAYDEQTIFKKIKSCINQYQLFQ